MRTLLAILILVTATTASAADTNYYLDLVNTANNSLVAFAVAPVGSNAFRDVRFGSRALQGGGDSTTIAIRNDASGCLRDLRAEFANGRVLIQRNFDVCKYRSYHTGRYLRGSARTVVASVP
jgi:hypothetical protein